MMMMNQRLSGEESELNRLHEALMEDKLEGQKHWSATCRTPYAR